MRTGSRWLLPIALLATSLTWLPAPSAAADPLVVSGYSDARVDSSYGLFSDCGGPLREFLTDTSRFGDGGTVDRAVTLLEPGVDTVGPGTLDGVDVFFTGWVETDTYTPEERDALLAFVLGGGTMIATTDDTSHNIADLFGVTLTNADYTTATPTATTSPLIDGPFGTVTQIGFSGNQGVYSDLGPATEIADADPDLGPAVALIPPGALGAGSGAVVLIADVDVFTDATDEDCASAPGGLVNNETFVGNVFAYLADVTADEEPATTTTTSPTSSTTAGPTTTTVRAAAVVAQPRFTG